MRQLIGHVGVGQLAYMFALPEVYRIHSWFIKLLPHCHMSITPSYILKTASRLDI